MKLSTCISLVTISVVIFTAFGVRCAAAAPSYTVTDLDPGVSIYPVAINNYGQVIGDSHVINSNSSGYTGTAFEWQPSSANSTVGTYESNFGFPLTARVAAAGINSSGQVIGYDALSGGSFQSFLFTPTASNSVAGTMVVLPFTNTAATGLSGGINDVGEVVASAGPNNTATFSPTKPNGSTGTITNFAGQGSDIFYGPTAISNSGSFTGVLSSQHGGTYQAGRFTPSTINGTTGSFTDIADNGQGGSVYYPGPGGGYGINSVGDIAANGSPAVGSNVVSALLWKANGDVINISTLLGSNGQNANGINDADQVVGGESVAGQAFIYTGGTAYNLNSLITDSSWSLSTATAINNAGEIVGVGIHNGVNAAFLLTPVATAVTRQWTSTSSGDWNVASNWNGGVPNAAGAEADFFSAITTNHTVYTDIPITAGTINFNNANTYVITGSSTLTLLGTSTQGAVVVVQAGTQELNLPIYVASNAVFNVASGATLVIGNPLTVIAGKSLVQTGSGTVTYESTITLQSGSTFGMSSPSAVPTVTMGPASTFVLATHAAGSPATLLQVTALSLDQTATLDITNNAVAVTGGTLTTIAAEIKSGYNPTSPAALWTGTGITSSTAAGDTAHLTAVGVALNTNAAGNEIYGNGTAAGLFEGADPGANAVLIRYTYYGDANLDGKVDGSDFSLIDAGYLSHGTKTGWFNGDFNYDGVIDGSDYALIDNSFNTQGATLSAETAAPTVQIAAVPEPGMLTALSGFAGILSLRHRRSGKAKSQFNVRSFAI